MPIIGLMRCLVTVERRGTTQDALGAQQQTWTTFARVWMQIEALAGRELEAAQAVRSTDSHRLTLRYLAGLSAKDRVIYVDPEGVSRYYNISNVADMDMKHRFMECTAVEGLASG